MDKFTLKEMKGSGNMTLGQMQSKMSTMNPKSKTGKASLQDEMNHHDVLTENVASIEKQLAEAKDMANEKERHIQEKRMLEQQRSRGGKCGRLYDNPVFKEYWSTEKLGIVMDDDALVKYQEVFATADPANVGYLGQRGFQDLLRLLGVDVDEVTLESMFKEMDEDNSGTIEFGEFTRAMFHHLTPEQIDKVGSLKPGACGTSSWKRGEIVWCENDCLIIIAIGTAVALCVMFAFVLVPLTLAYFFVFLFTPVMNVLEFRPFKMGKTCAVCDPFENDPDAHPKLKKRRYKSAFRRSVLHTPKGGVHDFFSAGKLSHGISVVATLAIVASLFVGLVLMLSNEVKVLMNDKVFMDAMDDGVQDVYDDLNASGFKIYQAPTEGHATRYTKDQLMSYISAFSDIINFVGLVLLLTVYLMFQKPGRTMWDEKNIILNEIEVQIMFYISLKTLISFVTGIAVTIILGALQVKLAVLFGLLSFLLNFIPNVGSMIAICLPLPLVFVDPTLDVYQKVGAFVGPGIVQGYVGNALEPMLFGAALNMTPLAILAALVIWGSIWGLTGAVLSVPLLSVQKILLTHCNHPMAKGVLMMIREDPTADESAAAGGWDSDEE